MKEEKMPIWAEDLECMADEGFWLDLKFDFNEDKIYTPEDAVEALEKRKKQFDDLFDEYINKMEKYERKGW